MMVDSDNIHNVITDFEHNVLPCHLCESKSCDGCSVKDKLNDLDKIREDYKKVLTNDLKNGSIGDL